MEETMYICLHTHTHAQHTHIFRLSSCFKKPRIQCLIINKVAMEAGGIKGGKGFPQPESLIGL